MSDLSNYLEQNREEYSEFAPHFEKIVKLEDKISDIEKDIKAHKRKLKQLGVRFAEFEGYGKGACFRDNREDVWIVVGHKVKRYILIDDFVIGVFLICRKLNKKGFLDKRSTETITECLNGIEKILSINQDIFCKENINDW